MNKKRFLLFCLIVGVLGVLLLIWLFGHHKPADVTADFGDRTSTYAIPPNFFGSGGVGSTVSSQSGIDNLTRVNLRGNRIWINLHIIFAKSDLNHPDYSLWDGQLQRGTSGGLDPLITIFGTPPSLGSSDCAFPSDINKWVQFAVAAIQHTDQLHPGLWYELWNEPDGIGFCSNTTDKLQSYLKLYTALGPAFRKAAPTAKFGGPTLASSGNTTTWIPALLSGATAPYVDFVSWHIYITGSWLLPDMTWQQAFDTTQNPSQGLAYYYRLLEQTVRKGSQPNAATTPIVVSEYNTNYAFEINKVQNDWIYGPLWNMVAVADFLNVVAQGSFPPTRINYFMSSYSQGLFCLEGVSASDPHPCAVPKDGQPYNAVYVPYPTLLPYQLFCASDYLNLEVGGFSVVQPPAAPDGLMTMQVYNGTSDDLVLINPTGTAVSGLRVKMDHLGFKATGGQKFVLSNNALAKSDLSTAHEVTTDVPAYSTVALSLKSQ